jgi:hypothetical protein
MCNWLYRVGYRVGYRLAITLMHVAFRGTVKRNLGKIRVGQRQLRSRNKEYNNGKVRVTLLDPDLHTKSIPFFKKAGSGSTYNEC